MHIVDDDVEAAPIYRSDGKAGQPSSKALQESWPVYGMGTYTDR